MVHSAEATSNPLASARQSKKSQSEAWYCTNRLWVTLVGSTTPFLRPAVVINLPITSASFISSKIVLLRERSFLQPYRSVQHATNMLLNSYAAPGREQLL